MIGLKIRKDNLDLVDAYEDIFDFFEIYIGPDFPLNELHKYSGRNITIHAAHYDDMFDPSQPSLHDISKRILKKAIDAADIVKSHWIIVHPGHNISENSEHYMLDFFDRNYDSRVIFENCPAIDNNENGLKYLFSLPNEMKNLIERYNTSFVLDFGHAICTANVLNQDPMRLINEFIRLNPKCFHLSGIFLSSKIDTHLHLFETGMPYLSGLSKEKHYTFETPYNDLRNISLQKKDIEFFNNSINH